MKIKYFAWIKEITQNDEEEINSDEIDNLDQLKKFLMKLMRILHQDFHPQKILLVLQLLQR